MIDEIMAIKAENESLKCSCAELMEQRNRAYDEVSKMEVMLKEECERNVELKMRIQNLEGAVEAYRFCVKKG